MSKRLKELRQRQHDLKAEATALLDAADKDDRDLTEAEETRYSEIEAELEKLKSDIAAEEKKADRRRNLEAVRTSVPAFSIVSNEPNPATTGGFRSIAEFARAVHLACRPGAPVTDPRLLAYRNGSGIQAAPANYHEGGGSAGEGFELPVQYRDELWQLIFDMDDLLTDVDLEPTSARQIDWVADETTPWGSTGVQASWRAEGSQMVASKLATKGRSLTLHELYAFVIATDELLEDAPRLNNRLTLKAAQAINWKINDALFYGSGAGQPLGWFNAPAAITVAKESGQTADTIVAANVLKMYSRLLVAPGDQPVWLANRDTVPQLSQITIGDRPVWLPPNGLVDAPGGFLLGYPIRWSEHCKTLGDLGDIQLISPKGYYAARRTQGVQFASSMHLFFDYGMQAFRWTFRFGGQPHLSAPVSPANGTNTKSHFVLLEAR
jgi:HK97 family phage major capsid protein